MDCTSADPEIRRLVKKETAAVIPVGATEQHGAHLPVSTDSDIVTEVARRISENNGYLLLPTVSCGVSYEHAPYTNISIKKETLRAMISDMCRSLAAGGTKTVFVINGHHGNQKALASLSRLKKPRVFVFSYWHHMGQDFDHAGFAETSLMLAISKKTDMKRAKKGLDPGSMKKSELTRVSRLAQRQFIRATKNGIWGDPTQATRRDGQRMLSELVANLGKRCQTCLTGGGP